MLLQADLSLAEVPGFDAEQLETLTRSVELKKQKLEADIDAYIKKKQRELAQYEQEVPHLCFAFHALIALIALASCTVLRNRLCQKQLSVRPVTISKRASRHHFSTCSIP